MLTGRVVLVASLVVGLTCAVPEGLAQTKPDFTGQWSFDWTSFGPLAPGATVGPGRGAPRGGSFGEAFTATQDARLLLVTYTDLDRPVRQEFALDGSETVNTVPTRRGQWQERSLARWEGAKLVIVTKLPSNVLTRTLSLVSGVLVMDIVLTVQAGTPMVSTIRYTKGGAR